MAEQYAAMEIDRASLEPVVRQALGRVRAEVLGWRVEPLGGGAGAALGAGVLHRVAGTAEDQGAVRAWSLVRKRLRPPAGAGTGFSLSDSDPSHQLYWKREALVYASQLLHDLPAGLAAPRCFGIDEHEDGIVLWLEDVADSETGRWSLQRYGEAARHLGRFNGAYLVGRPLPVDSWLCRDMVHWRQALAAPFWEGLADRRDDRRVRRGWPGNLADRSHQVWVERDRFFAVLAQVPQVLCHGDAERRNLLVRKAAGDATETVAIDWAYLGPQVVGTDAATLTAQSVLWAGDREPGELPTLSRLCYEGYVTGLREIGWTGNERMVHLGFAAALSLRFLVLTGPIVMALASEEERPRLEAGWGTRLETILDRHAAMQPYLLDVADEVRRMMSNS